MTSKIVFSKLDKRNKGYGHWQYRVEVKPTEWPKDATPHTVHQFVLQRAWCWNTWGASKTLDEWLQGYMHSIQEVHNTRWVWQTDDYSNKIFINNDQDLSMFLLRWG